jgi:hypothetical protein
MCPGRSFHSPPSLGKGNGSDFKSIIGTGRHPTLQVKSILLASNDQVRVQDYRHLSAGTLRLLRAASRSSCHALASFCGKSVLARGFGQIAANTNFFVVRYTSRDRLAVLQKHKRNVLIVRAVNAVRKIARSFRDGYARFLHKSDYLLFLGFFG